MSGAGKTKLSGRALFGWSMASLLVIGMAALAIVWVRMDISRVASETGRLEGETEDLNRELRELRGRRSTAMRPAVLANLMAGRLAMPVSERRLFVTEEELRRRTAGPPPPADGIGGKRVYAGTNRR